MKEKTKAFYKAVFKYWIKNSIAPFIIALMLQAIIGYVYYVKKWDMGQTALFILTWEFTKRCFKEREVLHEQKAKEKTV